MEQVSTNPMCVIVDAVDVVFVKVENNVPSFLVDFYLTVMMKKRYNFCYSFFYCLWVLVKIASTFCNKYKLLRLHVLSQ